MDSTITTILLIALAGFVIQFFGKLVMKILGWVVITAAIVYGLYHFGIGPFAKNPINVVSLQQTYCVTEPDVDICECIITPIRNDMEKRFSKEELAALEDNRGEALYVFQKSYSKMKPEISACLAKREAEDKLNLFLKGLIPIDDQILEEVDEWTQKAKQEAEETLADWNSTKESIDDKYND